MKQGQTLVLAIVNEDGTLSKTIGKGIKCKWSEEAEEDLRNVNGVEIETEIENILIYEYVTKLKKTYLQ